MATFRKELLDARPPLTAPPPLSAPSARVLPAEESAWDIVAQHAATSSAFGGGSRMLMLGGKQDTRRPNSSIDLPALRQTPVRTVAGMRAAMAAKMPPSLGKANMVGTSSSRRLGEYWNSLAGREERRCRQGGCAMLGRAAQLC